MINAIKWYAYGYTRISKDDKENLESNSISNQKSLIENFMIDRDDIKLVDIKVDDGFRGGNTERPAFQELLAEIEKGVINCVIVKDSSRFGRDFIDSGKFIEKYFVSKNVRFISITENYDTFNTNDSEKLMFSFRNILNDAYLEDISNKTKSALKSKRKKGVYLGAFAPYGYIKTHDKKLVADEYASGIVKRIFNDKIDGYNEKAISDRLNVDGVLSPLEYKKSIGLNYTTTFKSNEKSLWSAKAVNRILTNKIYLGHLEQGKRKSADYKAVCVVSVPESEWDITENNHEPIISEMDFFNVQKLMNKDTRTSQKRQKLHLFSGYLFCGHCNEQMLIKPVKKENKEYIYYICSSHKNYKSCIYKSINNDTVYDFVFNSLKNQIEMIAQFESILQSRELRTFGSRQIKRIDELISHSFNETEKLNRYLLKSYEDYLSEVISKEEYTLFKNKFNKDIKSYHENIDNLTKEKANIEACSNFDTVINTFSKYKTITELDRAVIVYFIDKIIVYGNNMIEIVYKYKDEFDFLCETAFVKTADKAVI